VLSNTQTSMPKTGSGRSKIAACGPKLNHILEFFLCAFERREMYGTGNL
jgi:hypothetical protein